jgi:hypothetical protein
MNVRSDYPVSQSLFANMSLEKFHPSDRDKYRLCKAQGKSAHENLCHDLAHRVDVKEREIVILDWFPQGGQGKDKQNKQQNEDRTPAGKDGP